MNREDRTFLLDLLRLTETRPWSNPPRELIAALSPGTAYALAPGETPKGQTLRESVETILSAEVASMQEAHEKCEQLKLDLIERARNGYGCVACYQDHVEWTPQPHVREVRTLPPTPGLFWRLSSFALKVLSAAALVSAGMWLASHGYLLR